MKTPMILICAALALSACNPGGVNSAATQAVAKTVTASNDLYTHASRAGEDLVVLGLLDKATYKAADARAYAILIRVRAGQATFAELATATALLTGGK